jgi:hypothetical protein
LVIFIVLDRRLGPEPGVVPEGCVEDAVDD